MSRSLQSYHVDACKFEYEFMGKDPSELAESYQFPVYTIEDEIEKGNWVRRLEPTTLPETTDIIAFADQLETITRSKLSIISLFRQIDNQSIYAQIEKALLDKILDCIKVMDSTDARAATKLYNLAKTVTAIQERDPIDLATELSKQLTDSGPRGVVVQIANHIQ